MRETTSIADWTVAPASRRLSRGRPARASVKSQSCAGFRPAALCFDLFGHLPIISAGLLLRVSRLFPLPGVWAKGE